MIKRSPALLIIFLLAACAGGQNYNASLLPSQGGRDHYAVNGVMQTFEPDKPQVTRTFVTQQMAGACPDGLEFDRSYKEAPLNWTPFGTWVQYNGTVICKDASTQNPH